jgi:hypothetical protein
MNDEAISELARALGMPLTAEQRAGVAESLSAQIAGGGGLTAEELDGVEPAVIFEPSWAQ